ncbi:rna-binding protein luc7-like expressed [Nannochloropsis oceanica]
MGKWGGRAGPLSGVDAQRAMLDEMMGMNRNLDNPDAEIADYRDERVCKQFLLGCCPHEVFSKTKIDLGQCERLHDEGLQQKFEADLKKEEEEWEGGREGGPVAEDRKRYERDLEMVLREYIYEADRKIARGRRRTDVPIGEQQQQQQHEQREPLSSQHQQLGGGGVGVGTLGVGGREGGRSDLSSNPEILRLQGEIEEVLAKAEAAGEEGEVDEAQELSEKAEELKRQKNKIQERLLAEGIEKGGMGGREGGHPGAKGPGGIPSLPPTSTAATTAPANAAAPSSSSSSSDPNQRLRVCDVCGAFLSISDNDKRLADHFGGKLHLGYVLLREKMKEIQDRRREGGKRRGRDGGGSDGPEGGSWGGRGGGGGGRERGGRGRSGSRERERRGGRSRSRSRERGREGGRGGRDYREDRERERGGGDRYRERGRDRDNGRGGRDRSRSRSRERGGRRY